MGGDPPPPTPLMSCANDLTHCPFLATELQSKLIARAETVPRAPTDKSPATKARALSRFVMCQNQYMLLAYIDEIGEPGAFISPTHHRFNTSPAFGYAGFIIPANKARVFGSAFTAEKKTRFAKELSNTENPGRWEAKGAELFRPPTPEERPENLRIFGYLVERMSEFGGSLFYYANEKPIGTPKQTRLDPEIRERDAMQETLNRIARHAYHQNQEVMVLIDSINEKTRITRIADMYAHIFSRSSIHPDMKSIVEPPMHIDSNLSSNIQFADWVAAYVTRAIDRQLIEDSKYKWIPSTKCNEQVYRTFTHESKLHFHSRSIEDLNHSEIISRPRPLYPKGHITSLQKRLGADQMRKIKAAAEKQYGRGNR